MIKSKETKINDVTYRITLMDAFTALKLQTKLAKLIGKSFTHLFEDGDTKEKIKLIVQTVMENFNDELVNEIITLIFEKNVLIAHGEHSRPLEFETHFAGKPLDMWKLALYVIGENLGMGKYIESILLTIKDVQEKTQEN